MLVVFDFVNFFLNLYASEALISGGFEVYLQFLKYTKADLMPHKSVLKVVSKYTRSSDLQVFTVVKTLI